MDDGSGCGAAHAVGSAEVLAHVGDELPVRRMVDGLDANNLRHKGTIVLFDVLHELELGVRRS